ncbi:histidine phosphatase family protein [Herbiconiux sp. VKM Ac-1786]|uniref:histidine phosphatase family protein n=1 Tax=Herbiconiux sp. VKM Ac-1786 TaxID=2783824 RepID=UPI00188C5B7A|nr:histidine phosphatase family protein [Herbiconiux sp. VKM Ac-1786]MBF4571631.1 histidine phosphatase family protein [Herbiconiux sp. VKM Ac-1786]
MTHPAALPADHPDAGATFKDAARGTAPQVVLVRHGETEWSLDGRHTGRTDIPLTARGEEQAAAVARVLAGRSFGLVLSSPRRRAVETAAIVGYPDVETDADLVEWDYGAYEGLTSPQISEAYGDDWNLWRDGVQPTAEGVGEQAADLLRRNQAIIRRAHLTLNRGEDVLLFSHGHYLRTLAATWIGAPISTGEYLVLDTAALCVLGFEHGNQVLRQWNRSPWQEEQQR